MSYARCTKRRTRTSAAPSTASPLSRHWCPNAAERKGRRRCLEPLRCNVCRCRACPWPAQDTGLIRASPRSSVSAQSTAVSDVVEHAPQHTSCPWMQTSLLPVPRGPRGRGMACGHRMSCGQRMPHGLRSPHGLWPPHGLRTLRGLRTPYELRLPLRLRPPFAQQRTVYCKTSCPHPKPFSASPLDQTPQTFAMAHGSSGEEGESEGGPSSALAWGMALARYLFYLFNEDPKRLAEARTHGGGSGWWPHSIA